MYASYTRTSYGVGDLIPAAALPEPRSRFDRTVAIDAAAGTVEIATREYLPDAPRRLIRDASGRLFTWEADARPVARDGNGVLFEHVDPTSPGDGGLGRYVVLSPSLEEVVSFQLPSRDWRIKLFDFDGGYVLARGGDNIGVVDLAVGTSVRLSPHADAAHAFPPFVRSYHPLSTFRDAEVLETTDGFALLLPGAVGYRSSLLRYRWPDELLSDVSFDYVTAREYWDAGNVTETGYKLSPDGLYLAVTSLVWGRESGSVETALTTVSVLDAATGEELMRIGGAVFPVRYLGIGVAVDNPGVWLADSSGLVVDTFIGRQIAMLDGKWFPVPQRLSKGRLLPSPDDPALFLHDDGTVVDLEGETRVSVAGDVSDRMWWRGTWGETSRELRLRSWPTDGRGYVPVWNVMYPAIQTPGSLWGVRLGRADRRRLPARGVGALRRTPRHGLSSRREPRRGCSRRVTAPAATSYSPATMHVGMTSLPTAACGSTSSRRTAPGAGSRRLPSSSCAGPAPLFPMRPSTLVPRHSCRSNPTAPRSLSRAP